jgi:hypothetical protein
LTAEQYDTAHALWESNPGVTAPTQAMCQQYAIEQGGTYEQARAALYQAYSALPPSGSRADKR